MGAVSGLGFDRGRVLVKAGFLYTGEIQPRHCLARGETIDTRMMVWLA